MSEWLYKNKKQKETMRREIFGIDRKRENK